MPNFQDNQFPSGSVHLIDDPIITDAIPEAAAPFFPVERAVAQQFRVLPHPLQFVQDTRLKSRVEMLGL